MPLPIRPYVLTYAKPSLSICCKGSLNQPLLLSLHLALPRFLHPLQKETQNQNKQKTSKKELPSSNNAKLRDRGLHWKKTLQGKKV